MSETPVTDKWTEAKAWYKSKTIIGVIIALAGTAVKLIWPETPIDVEGAVDVVIESGDSLATGIDSMYGTAMELFGLAMAAWGRFKAHTSIK